MAGQGLAYANCSSDIQGRLMDGVLMATRVDRQNRAIGFCMTNGSNGGEALIRIGGLPAVSLVVATR